MSPPRVSIVIPTHNGRRTLEPLLDAIDGQAGGIDREIIAIDSGSTDGTVQLLEQRGATVLTVGPGAFNHGGTRNEALDRAKGEFAVLTVQDALPASPRWLELLLHPLLADPQVAGSFARQVPRPGASLLTWHYLSLWVAAQAAPRTVGPLSRAAFDALTPMDRLTTCAFDNVCSCVRISVWKHHRFHPTPIAEDLEWGMEVLLAGHKLAYVPDAVVCHSHERPVQYELQRTYLVHQRLQALFGLATVPTIGSLIRSVGVTVPLHARLAARESRGVGRALVKGAALAVVLPLGQYLGARSARERRELLRTRGI